MASSLPCAATFCSSRRSLQAKGVVFADESGKKWVRYSSSGINVAYEGVFYPRLDTISCEPFPQQVVGIEHSKYPLFYQFIGALAQDGPPPNSLLVIPQSLTNASGIPLRICAPEGPHSKYALKVGYLMQFLFLSDPSYYFRQLCQLFSCPDEVCSFFPVQFDRLLSVRETSNAVSVAFGRAAIWTELVVALQLHKCFIGKKLVGTDLGKVAVFQPSQASEDPPTKVLLDLFAGCTDSLGELGWCVAQLARIAQHLPRKQWCALWGLVSEKHRNDEPMWQSAYSSMQQLQKSKLVGAFVQGDDIFRPNPNITVLRVSACICPLTCELYTTTLSQLAASGDANSFSTFLGTMEVVLEGTSRGVVARVLYLWGNNSLLSKSPSLSNGSEIANAQRLLQFSIAMSWR